MAIKTLMKLVRAVFLIAVVLAAFRKADGDRSLDRDYYNFFHEHVTATTGILSSPNYPNPYSASSERTWVIETTPGQRIKLMFHSFDLESSFNCGNDYVAIYDGGDEYSPTLGIFCGDKLPPPVISSTNKMFIEFLSNRRVQGKGFKLTHTTVSSTTSILAIEACGRDLVDCLRTSRRSTHSIYKWGPHITRTAVALFLIDPKFFAPSNKTGEEIAYELSLKLLSKLTLKKKIPTNDLALYINALTVACINPKDFFGINLVDELRKRVNNSNYTRPFSILTLCNAGDTMTLDDVLKLQQQYDAHFRPIWTDTQAMVVMALSCISSRSDVGLDDIWILDEMVSELKKKQHKNGTIDNLRTTALVVQALLAADSYETDFNLAGAINFILQEVNQTYPSIQDIYYILPIFNFKTLANISSKHCEARIETDSEVIKNLPEYPYERILVQVSVVIGNDMDFSRTWKLKVPANYSIYQVLENIGTLEPAYKVQYSVSDGKPYVVALSKFQDDTEEGYFWFLYTKPLSSTGSPKLMEQSPVDVQVKETDELILWYRSGFWEKTQD